MDDLIRASALLINRDDDDENQGVEEIPEDDLANSDKIEGLDEEDVGSVDTEADSWQ